MALFLWSGGCVVRLIENLHPHVQMTVITVAYAGLPNMHHTPQIYVQTEALISVSQKHVVHKRRMRN